MRARHLPLLVTLPLCAASCDLVLPSTLEAVPASSALPEGWDTCSVPTFERLAAAFEPRALTSDELQRLGAALVPQDLVSVRAAVLLARSRDPRARELVLERLELRVLGPARESDAGDCTAAAALTTWDLGAPELDRVEALVVGDAPHPDVEVRTELACALLRNGRRTAVPFLLRILREGTREQDASVEWERKPQMAWCKSRAAETLSEAAGVDCAYEEDGAFDAMAAEATRLEGLLRE